MVSTSSMVDTIPVPSRRNLLCAVNCALTIDPQRNAKGNGLVSADTSRIPVWVIATDEERLIARQTRELITSGAL
jgi:acetate kinase